MKSNEQRWQFHKQPRNVELFTSWLMDTTLFGKLAKWMELHYQNYITEQVQADFITESLA